MGLNVGTPGKGSPDPGCSFMMEEGSELALKILQSEKDADPGDKGPGKVLQKMQSVDEDDDSDDDDSSEDEGDTTGKHGKPAGDKKGPTKSTKDPPKKDGGKAAPTPTNAGGKT